MNPTDLANAVEALPDARRQELAEMLHDEQLADVLEELPEQDQVRLLASLGVERGADVVEEMQPDDAADLLAEMPPEQRERLLAAMETVQAADLRRLLRYDATTAGGLMTSQPLIVPPDTPVAEVLAQIRDPRMPATSAAQVYVCEPPTVTPTGRFLGTVGFQAAAAAAAGRERGRVHRGQRAASSGRTFPRRRWPGAWPRTTSSAWPSATRTAACSARSPSTTSWTGSCPSGWRKGETHENAAAVDPRFR